MKFPATRLFVASIMVCLAAGCNLFGESSDKAATAGKPAAAAVKTDAAALKNLAVIDVSRVFKECNMGIQALKILQEANAKLRAEIDAVRQESEKSKTEEGAARYQEAVNAYQAKINQEQKRVFDLLEGNFLKVMSDYRQKNGLAMILRQDQVLSFGPESDVTDAVLLEMNKLSVSLPPVELKDKDNLVAPLPAAAANATAPAAAAGQTHTVLAGEGLATIAKNYNITPDALAQANGITDPNKLSVGQTLRIPAQPKPADKPKTDAP